MEGDDTEAAEERAGDDPSPPVKLESGVLVNERLRLARPLGQGGMGAVWVARHLTLEIDVAVKFIASSGEAVDPSLLLRFKREAQLAAKLAGPHVVRTLDHGVTGDGMPYIAMELLRGESLAERLESAGRLAPAALVRVIDDVAEGLAEAHALGIVHRDIKPQNLFVTRSPSGKELVKVLDFGIARSESSKDAATMTALTAAGGVVGTVRYMSPEQLMYPGEADKSADVWALAVVAYESLTGCHPFARDTLGATIAAITRAEAARPSKHIDVPGAVDALFDRAFALEPRVRLATAPEFAKALAAALDGVTLDAPQSRPVGGEAESASQSTAEFLARQSEDLACAGPQPPSAVDVARAPLTARATTGPASSTAEAPTAAGYPETPSAETNKEALAPRVGRAQPKRSWVWMALGGGAVASVALAVGWAGLSSAPADTPPIEPKVEYCNDWIDTRSGPQCLAAVDASDLGRRLRTIRLTGRAHGVDSVELLTAGGLAIDGGERTPTRFEVRRDAEGAVEEIIGRDQSGEEMVHEVWSEGGTRVDFVEPDGKAPRHWPGTSVTRVRRVWDERGYVARETYFGVTDEPRPHTRGVFGRELENDDAGFVVREAFLGADGSPMADANGVAVIERIADARGMRRDQSGKDLDGKVVLEDGVATERSAYDESLEVTDVAFLDAEGRPTPHLGYGTHGVRVTRDAARRTVRYTLLDGEGKPRPGKGGSSAAFDKVYDDRGRCIEVTDYDAAGNPVVTLEYNVAGWRYSWDDANHVIAREALDPSGRPMRSGMGWAKRVDDYDARGRVVAQHHFDETGKPTPSLQGPSTIRVKVDDRGLTIAHELLDSDGRLSSVVNGFASSRWRYDGLRNEIEKAVFGVDGKPAVDEKGIGVYETHFDADDVAVEVVHEDAAGALTFACGFARKRMKHDERGFIVEEAFFDANDRPVLAPDSGCAIIRRARDRSGDVTEEACLDARGEPIAGTKGYAKKAITYDVRRRATQIRLIDAAGATAVLSDGWAITENEYDERGFVVRERYLDASGEPIVIGSSHATLVRTYDARGNLAEVTTLGADAKPRVTSEGYATKRTTYDAQDRMIEEELLDAGGATVVGASGWAFHKVSYDEIGNRSGESFFDDATNPIVPTSPGYARKRDRFDAYRRLVEVAYFDAAGVPMKGPEGAEAVRYVRDSWGRAIETAYLDAAGKPTLSNDTKSIVHAKYDDAGRLIEESYVGSDGKPLVAKNGCAGRRVLYEEHGYVLETTCVGESGNPAISDEGYATKRFLRDAQGRIAEEATYDAQGKPMADQRGVARTKHRYDERGLLVEHEELDAKGKPVRLQSK